MKKVYDHYKGDARVVFLAVQTVFEGRSFNTRAKLIPAQKKYDLPILMGHDDSAHSKKYPFPTTMVNYRTGGTPWVVIIDTRGRVVFNQFHIQPSKAMELIKALLPG